MKFKQNLGKVVLIVHEMYEILEHPHQAERSYQIANFFAPYLDKTMNFDIKWNIAWSYDARSK